MKLLFSYVFTHDMTLTILFKLHMQAKFIQIAYKLTIANQDHTDTMISNKRMR